MTNVAGPTPPGGFVFADSARVPAIADSTGLSTATLTIDASGRQTLALNINTGTFAYSHTFDLTNATQPAPLFRGVAEGPTIAGEVEHPLLIADTLSFAKWGVWQHQTGGGAALVGAFAAGQATPPTSMPVSGTASFTGQTVGFLNAATGPGAIASLAPGAIASLAPGAITGNAQLTANFGQQSVAADFTGTTPAGT